MPQNPSEYYNWTQTLNVYKFTNEPILVMFNCERSALKFAQMSDEELLESAFKVLTKIFPEFKPEFVVQYWRTNWSQEQYSKMCYTYVSKDGSPKDCETLQKPINDLIYMCGEHLCFDFIGTVNGAYISGVQAAERIIGGYVSDLMLLILIMTLISKL